MANPTLEEHIEALSREFGETDIEDALLMFALRRRRDLWELLTRLNKQRSFADQEWLGVAALLATRRDAMVGKEGLVRDWLELFALRERILQSVSGSPGSVLDERLKSMTIQTQIQRGAMQRIWREPMLKPAAVAATLGWRGPYRRKLQRYRLRSWLVGFYSGGAYHYPEFQFDSREHDIFPEVRVINETLDAASDPWGVASWWIFAHDRLGARPADLVGTDRRGDLVEAAEAVLEPVG